MISAGRSLRHLRWFGAGFEPETLNYQSETAVTGNPLISEKGVRQCAYFEDDFAL